MPENKDERTEELPVTEEADWDHEDTETHMTPIDADEPMDDEASVQIPLYEVQPMQSQKNKIIWIVILVILIFAVGIGGFFVIRNYNIEQEKKQAAYDKVYEQLKVVFKEEDEDGDGNKYDPTLIEYGSSAADPQDLVDTYYGNLSYEPSVIDTSKVGTTTIAYTASMEDEYDVLVSKQFTLDVTIQDTQVPVITCTEEELTITEEDEFDAKSNIESVKDAVDGDLQYVESEPAKINEAAPYYETGWYTITSDVDTEEAGSYTVEIHASDINGNTSDASYTVTVKQKDPTSYMHIGSYSVTQMIYQIAGTTVSDSTNTSESAGSGPDDWENVDSYLGTTLYESGQYDSQDAMMSDGRDYLEENLSSLLQKKSGKTDSLSVMSETRKTVSVYYMSALDDEGNAMYYFFAIV